MLKKREPDGDGMLGEQAGRARRGLYNDPVHNTKLPFRISRDIHMQMKVYATRRHVPLHIVYTEAFEMLLERRAHETFPYYAPPMKTLSIETTIWVARALNDRIYELGRRDERPIGAVVETAAICYLQEHSPN